jgi:hypothetical protein
MHEDVLGNGGIVSQFLNSEVDGDDDALPQGEKFLLPIGY